jgi:hypothetical protein
MAGVTSFILAVALLSLFTALDFTMVIKYSQQEAVQFGWPLKWMTQELSDVHVRVPQEPGMVDIVSSPRLQVHWLHLGANLTTIWISLFLVLLGLGRLRRSLDQ